MEQLWEKEKSLRVLPQLKEYFCNTDDLNCWRQTRLSQVFGELIKSFYNSDEEVVSCSELKQVIGSMKSIYNGTSQEDCVELLADLLSWLHKDVGQRGTHEKRIQGCFASKETVWRYIVGQEDSFIRQNFHYLEMSTLVCQNCGMSTSTFVMEPGPIVSLDVPLDAASGCLLEECLQMYCKPILVDDFSCERCLRKHIFKRSVSFARLPPVLVLHLKRFRSHTFATGEVDETLVKYPLVLKVKECQIEKQYDLFGVVCHIGNINNGHYFNYSKIDKWYKCNDAVTTEVSPTDIIDKNAVLLFYVESRSYCKESQCSTQKMSEKGNQKRNISSVKRTKHNNEQATLLNKHCGQYKDVVHDHTYVSFVDQNHDRNGNLLKTVVDDKTSEKSPNQKEHCSFSKEKGSVVKRIKRNNEDQPKEPDTTSNADVPSVEKNTANCNSDTLSVLNLGLKSFSNSGETIDQTELRNMPIQNLKCDFASVKENKQFKNRICAATNCVTDMSCKFLYTFPKVLPSNSRNVRRCKIWLQRSGNKSLLQKQMVSLYGRKFLCEKHFETDQFCINQTKRLRCDAVPTIFNCLPIDDEIMLQYSQPLNLTEDSIDLDAVHLIDGLDRNMSNWSGNIENGNLFGKNQTVNNSSNLDFQQSDIDRSVSDVSSIKVELCKTDQESSSKGTLKKCAAINCASGVRCGKSLFRFPKVDGLADVNVERCKEWLQRCGNKVLLLAQLDSLYKNVYLCSDHFQNSQFINEKKNRLVKDAIPTVFNCVPIEKELMIKYFGDKNASDVGGRWLNSTNQPDYYTHIVQFEEKMKTLHLEHCNVCKEKRLTFGRFKCSSKCSDYSVKNNMDPGDVPEELKGLSFVEEQLIALNHPCISVFKLKGLQYGYSGNVITFPQDVHGFAKQLPHRVQDLPSILTVKYSNNDEDESNCNFFQVRSDKIYKALLWLQKNNKYYADIEISEANLNLLPSDGSVYNDLESLCLENDCSKIEEENHSIQGDFDVYFSGLPKKTLPNSDDQIMATLYDWPTISSNPVNEFTTPGYIACAFPTLYPTGEADLRDGRLNEVKPSDYFKHLLNYYDGRFARHCTFRFFALNSWMRWNALTNGSLFVRNNKDFSNLSVSTLKAMLKDNPSIIRKILYQGVNLRGTRPFWSARCNELIDMIEQIGMPTVFISLSAADLHWPDLYRMLSNESSVSELSEKERRELLQNNPLLVDLFFVRRVEAFFDKILGPYFKIKDYWWRFEWQSRGSLHLHGVLWFDGAPDVTNLKEASEEHLKEIIEYFDKIVSAVNPNRNCETFDTHPCRNLFQDSNDIDVDLAQLLVKVQRHTKCSTAYCLRTNKKTGQRQCRFKFPFNLQECSAICMSEDGEPEFFPARNDPLLNKFNIPVQLGWRGNIDFSPVLSKKRLVRYLSKYVSKCEVSSPTVNNVLNSILQNMNENDHVRKALRKLYIKICSERDYSAQEVCHILSGEKLYSAGKRNFVIINFSKSNEWVEIFNNTESVEAKTRKTTIEKYQARPASLEHLSLFSVCQNYDLQKWHKKQTFNIVRIFPKVSLGLNDENDEIYYRQNVLLHVPWRHVHYFPVKEYSWKEIYDLQNVLSLETQKCDIPNVHADNGNEEDLEEESQEPSPLEEWMIASRLKPGQVLQVELGLRTVDLEYNWCGSSKFYESYGSLDELRCFVRTEKDLLKENVPISVDENNVSYSSEQQLIIELMKKQVSDLKTGNMESIMSSPKRVIVQGKAGTGKSCVVKFLTKSLMEEFGCNSYLLLAPTGVAALNIGGQTVHSALRLSIGQNHFRELTGESAKKFCDFMRTVKFLIIDEYSMIGCSMLSMIDQRCRQGTGIDEPFGNLYVYLLGDIRQLPPIGDVPLYSDNPRTYLAKHGKALLQSFDAVCFLSQGFRQKDNVFQNLLDKLALGEISTADYEKFSNRFVSNATNRKSFENAIHLYATKAEVKDYNIQIISSLKDVATGQFIPIARINAQHNDKRASITDSDKAGGLEPVLYLSKNCKVMLRSNLWTEKGLVNGAIGKVVDILYKEGEGSPDNFPVVILCTFDCYTGPGIGLNKNIVPIPPVCFSWKSGSEESFSRTQLPLTLCYACSIHKSQGLTLSKAVVDIGPTEFSLGLSYVALSRTKTIDGLLLHPFSLDRISRMRTNISFVQREAFIQWMRSFSLA